MSNTVVKDLTPAPKPGDNALIIVVGEDGSLSVDPDTLSNLLNKGGDSTEVTIVRMSGSDTGDNVVNATLETFFDANASADTTNIVETPKANRTIMDELTVDIDEISTMCRNIQMDHCYTPLTSPSQKLEINKSHSSDLAQTQTLNKSTEDLMAVLEADNEPALKPATKVPVAAPSQALATETTSQPTEKDLKKQETNRLPQPAQVIVTSKVTTPTSAVSTATLVQNINKNFANITSAAKKTFKIVTVTKPATGIRPATATATATATITAPQPVIPVKEPPKEPPVPAAQKVKDLPPKEAKPLAVETSQSNASNDSKLEDDLSDISDSDFEMDDDSEDSDFDAGRQKISKPKYKTFGSKRSKPGGKKRDKSLVGNKGLANNRAVLKNRKVPPQNKEAPKPLTVKTNKLVKTKSKTSLVLEKEEPTTPITPVTSTTPQPEVISSQSDKQDQAKKLKKKVVKPAGLFDDGIALFSTPDVIRRVSVSGDSPTKAPDVIMKPRTLSMDQKMDSLENVSQLNEKVQNRESKIESKSSSITEVDSTTHMNNDATEQALAGLDSANLDLDLNADELIPEDLLYQVAKLVENADIQKVLDTNLTLADQSLDSVLPKTNDDTFGTKELQSMITENSMHSVASEESDQKMHKSSQQPSKQGAPNTASLPTGNLISKNTTNKPIQIVRPDGRVIIIPPIEKPATRSSKRKQGSDNHNSSSTAMSDTETSAITSPAPILLNTNATPASNQEKEKPKHVETNLRPEQPTGNADETDLSDSDESWKSEDDPDRLWCICKQPHNNRFMICCDTCEEWFHGQCVGVSKALGRQMEQQGKEWQCPNCQKAKKTALQQALNEAQATMDIPAPQQVATVVPPNEVQSDGETKPVQRCIVCKGPSRSESVYCSENCIVQHSNAVERVIVFERATGRCLSGNNAPTVANLKQWLKLHPGFEVVSSGNKTIVQPKLQLNKSGISKGVQQGVKIATKQPATNPNKPPPHILNHQLGKGLLQKSTQSFYGKQNQQTTIPNKMVTSTPIKPQQQPKTVPTPAAQIKSVKLIQPHTMVIKQPQVKPKVATPTTPITTQPSKPPPQEEEKVVKKKTQSSTPKPSPAPPQKISRQKSVSSITDEKQQPTKGPEQLRGNVRKTLAEHFLIRLKEQDEIKMSEESVKNLSHEIEAELYSLFNKDTGAKYRNRYRSLIFNIKDTKNETLWKRICQKAVSPKQLVRLSPEELASQELAQWRERETKHQLDMIKKTELDLLSCVRTYVLKSHKGEEVIEKRVDAVDSTIVADLDSSLHEERIVDSTSERPRSQDRNSKDSSRSKSADRKHRRESSSSRHRSNRDRSSRKHRDGSHDRKKRGRSKDRRRDGSKERRNVDSKKGRHRSRSGSRHKSSDRDKSRHKDKHDHKSKSSSKHKHNSRHKDSESDSTSSITAKNSSRDLNKSESNDLFGMGLDKKSKEILESLVDNKVVDNRILKRVEEPIVKPLNVPADSESDHEPSSTVIIATPPRNIEADSTPVDKPSVTSTEPVPEEPPPPDDTPVPTESIEKKIILPANKPLPPQTATLAEGSIVWRGFINMVDVAKVRITAQEVSGDCVSLAKELMTSLDIVGRISPETVWEYLGKMRRSTAKYISILRLIPESKDEQTAYQSLYTYLSSRKRFGVVKTVNTCIKDFYIMPQASYNPLPQVLLPLNGPGFEESRPNLLLGILVSSKRKRPPIYETSATILAKKTKESPPRSYTPPPSEIPKDPRIPQRTTLVSSIAMPPLPTVAPIPPPEPSKPDPPPLDDLDEPYSPGDSDDTLPTIPVNIISKPKLVTREKEKILPPVAAKPIVPELSIIEPFKTTNYPTIPGLDTPVESNNTSSLEILNLLSSTISSASAALEPSAIPTSIAAELVASTDLDALQRNIDEINKRIERERQEIDSISMGIVQKKDIESSCLANIALPSNLQQILDSIKTKKSDDSDIGESSALRDKAETTPMEEYTPVASMLSNPVANYSPSVSSKDAASLDEPLPTIPLLLPKLPRPPLELKPTPTNISDLNIPLNLPISKRTSSIGLKRHPHDHAIDSLDIKRKRGESTEDELSQIPLKLPLVSKKPSYSSNHSPAKGASTSMDTNLHVSTTPTKSSSVLSSLTNAELIQKANEMLAVQSAAENTEKVEGANDDNDENDDSSDSTDNTTQQVASIKQAPVLYPNISIAPPTHPSIPNMSGMSGMSSMRYMEQPPVPGLEDYE